MGKKKCVVCGKTFEAKGNNAKFCSEECRNAKIYTNEHVGEQHYELSIKSAYHQKMRLYVDCECSCGKKHTVRYDCLLSGNTKSCGHVGDENLIKPVDLSGKINKNGVKALYKTGKKGGYYVWRCLCLCGKEFDVSTELFQRIKSCGCARDRARKRQSDTILKDFRENAMQDGTFIYAIQDKKMLKNNTSGIRGVTWDDEREKWKAQIEFKGKNYFLGRYDKKEDAKEIRKMAEEKMFGNFLKWFAEQFPDRWKKINEKEQNGK